MRIFTFGDHHFCHKNILKFEPATRQFDTVQDMNTHMIQTWNVHIGKTDIVLYAGDFVMGNHAYASYLLNYGLNGDKYLIRGNHDRKRIKGWKSVSHIFLADTDIIIHNPQSLINLHRIHTINLETIKTVYHAHLHSRPIETCEWWEKFPYKNINFINVGVDVTAFKPIELPYHIFASPFLKHLLYLFNV